MLKIGDTVKVISDTVSHWDPEERTQYIPIGTICTVTEVENGHDGTPYYEVTPLGRDYSFCYLESELEKGHMEWIKDEEGKMMKELRAEVILYLKMKDGESEESATERMQKILDENGIEYSCFESSVEDNQE